MAEISNTSKPSTSPAGSPASSPAASPSTGQRPSSGPGQRPSSGPGQRPSSGPGQRPTSSYNRGGAGGGRPQFNRPRPGGGGGGRPSGGDFRPRRPGGPKRRFSRRKVCRFCVGKIKYIDYKNYRLLKDFLTERGKIMPRRITGTCAGHQRMLTNAIKRSRNMALLSFTQR